MDTAPVKAIALPAVYRANLEFQSHVPFLYSRTRSRTRARADDEGSASILTFLLYCKVQIIIKFSKSIASHFTLFSLEISSFHLLILLQMT